MIQQIDSEIFGYFGATPTPTLVDTNDGGPFSTGLSRITPITHWTAAVLTVIETGGIITHLTGSFTSYTIGSHIATLSDYFCSEVDDRLQKHLLYNRGGYRLPVDKAGMHIVAHKLGVIIPKHTVISVS
jgi:hypothetical protein